MKKSKKVNCDICGKEVFARGLKPHIRLQHPLSLTTQTKKKKEIDFDDLEPYRT